MGIEVIDLRLSQLDPLDLRGVPSISDGETVWNIPKFLPKDMESFGILFLDEINQAPPSVMAAAYQLILDRKLGDYELPKGWRIIAAGNKSSDRALTGKMGSALANRFMHIDIDVDVDTWIEWASKEGIDSRLMSFIQFRPKLLHDMDTTKELKAFPSPRTWSYVDRVLKASSEGDMSIIKCIVGDGAAIELNSYLKVFANLPKIQDIKDHPEVIKSLKQEPSVKYAVTSLISEHLTAKSYPQLIKAMEYLPKEFQVFCIKTSINRDPSLINCKEVTEWLLDNQEIFTL